MISVLLLLSLILYLQFDEKTRAKAEWMALVHDMVEAVIGDTTPLDGISQSK